MAAPPESLRYLGLELAGAKNEKTAVAALEYYPKERKVFLLDVYDRIAGGPDETSDDALLEVISELRARVSKVGVNVPLTLPPCIGCTRQSCPKPGKCSVPPVRWARRLLGKAEKSSSSQRIRPFTPYTQRPIELWIRYNVLPLLPPWAEFEIDETLGGNKAPLAARMHYLKRHLSDLELVEVWPKLSIAILSGLTGFTRRSTERYRQLEEGAQARLEILNSLAKAQDVFIYERDMRKLSQSLSAFDAFVCAYTALLQDIGECAKPPTGFPVPSGWIAYPELAG